MPPARLERAAYGLGNRRSIHLSYGGIGCTFYRRNAHGSTAARASSLRAAMISRHANTRTGSGRYPRHCGTVRDPAHAPVRLTRGFQ